jgi:hypothetical protein
LRWDEERGRMGEGERGRTGIENISIENPKSQIENRKILIVW